MTQAVAVAVERLVADGVLSPAQRDAVLHATEEARRDARPTFGRALAEAVAYLGAAIVFAGVVVLIDYGWDDLAQTGQVLLLVVAAGCSIAGGVVVVGGCRGIFRRVPIAPAGRVRLAAILFALGTCIGCAAVAIALDAADRESPAAVALTGLVLALLTYLMVPSVIGLALIGVAAGVTAAVLADYSHWTGALLLVIAAGWFAVAYRRVLVANWAGYLIGGVTGVVGAQALGEGESAWQPSVTAVVGLVALALAFARWEPVLVIGGAAALAIALGEVLFRTTDGGVGVPAIVITVGLIVLAVAIGVIVREQRGRERPVAAGSRCDLDVG
ncbi:DUF2157 domain-containing protein [Nocardia camponoti]|uniref:DUF2157 domain-containing protein n=1 Tax=Nocardia camponoti TaxID=1616106 RepID=A0A917QLB6_9NOCA|nr:DUF2157 domain-containing protein [Nocardia camponoti]GGK56043.1 hypothetical protein GCM10011591_30040 [Nocardia camponoti]